MTKTTKKIYFAARYQHHPKLVVLASHLRALDIETTSRWIQGEHQAPDADLHTNAPLVQQFALEDLEDVCAADTLVALAEPLRAHTRGGRHVELGMALALGKRVIVVGEPENVFHLLPGVQIVPSLDALVHLLVAERSGVSSERPPAAGAA